MLLLVCRRRFLLAWRRGGFDKLVVFFEFRCGVRAPAQGWGSRPGTESGGLCSHELPGALDPGFPVLLLVGVAPGRERPRVADSSAAGACHVSHNSIPP